MGIGHRPQSAAQARAANDEGTRRGYRVVRDHEVLNRVESRMDGVGIEVQRRCLVAHARPSREVLNLRKGEERREYVQLDGPEMRRLAFALESWMHVSGGHKRTDEHLSGK